MATFGAGGATTSYEEFENTDVIICWGSNTMENHPIIYNHMRRGIKNGAKMIVVDPRKIDQTKKADKWLGLNVGTSAIRTISWQVGQGALPQNSPGRPWNGDYIFSSGDLVEDLTHNFFLETEGARNNKLKVWEMVERPALER